MILDEADFQRWGKRYATDSDGALDHPYCAMQREADPSVTDGEIWGLSTHRLETTAPDDAQIPPPWPEVRR